MVTTETNVNHVTQGGYSNHVVTSDEEHLTNPYEELSFPGEATAEGGDAKPGLDEKGAKGDDDSMYDLNLNQCNGYPEMKTEL